MTTDPQLIDALAGMQLRLQQLESHVAATAVGSKVKLQVTFANPGTFELMTQVAEQVDEILHEHRRPPYKQWWPKKTWSPSKNNGPTPMELGAIRSYGDAVRGIRRDNDSTIKTTLTPEKREECRKNGTCFYCRQPGHIAAKCPTKPRMTSGNMMRHK